MAAPTPVRSYPAAGPANGVQSGVPVSGGPGQPGGPGGPPPPGGAAVPDSYFTESRKGEVNELRNLLRNFNVERDPQRKREVIKKVIAYMTLGIDVSRLFTEMMMAIETRDLVVKKMVYLFLCNYATANPDLAQMCTNTLQKDCGNDDPMVRGLALRALCSLRLPAMVEYISEPLRKALTDSHAYVRKTAVMGILKFHDLDRDAFQECNFVNILYDMLRDPDSQVVSNCILVLDEVMAKGPDGGMALNRAIMLHLLNRIHEFSEFGVLAVLNLVPRYIPANDEEGFQIMNLLDPVLRTNNPGTFMATVRAFLSIADSVGGGADDEQALAMKTQVITRIKAPLITLFTGSSFEMMYALLRHVDSLIELCPGTFDDEYRQFYVRYNEPTHIKYLKVAILPKLANPSNAPDIVSELGEYVTDIDPQLSRLGVRSMSRVACRDVGGEGSVQSIARRLVDMLDLDIGHVSSEAAAALVDVVRKHPETKDVVAPTLPRALKYVTESTGKAAVVTLLGECGDEVPSAPYCLEKLIDTYDDHTDAKIKTSLLTSTMKLLFRRAPEVKGMLGRLLAKAIEDVTNQDLHDRALLYYRLLRSSADLKLAEQVVSSSVVVPGGNLFAEEDDAEIRAELMQEFDTLSIVYGTGSENFIDEEFRAEFVRMPKEHPLAAGAPPPPELEVHAVAEGMAHTSLADNPAVAPAAAAPAAAAPVPAGTDVMDLLGFDGPPAVVPEPAPIAPPAASPGFELEPSFALTGEEYQSQWAAIPDGDAVVDLLPLRVVPPSTDAVEGPLAEFFVMTMASGELPTEFKFFLYGREKGGDGTVFLVQANANKNPADAALTLTVKCGGGGGGSTAVKVGKLMTVVRSALGAFV